MAEKESQVEKLKRISKEREHIRNICTSAHIHHGKCISGKSKIFLTDGSIKTAKEIFEIASKDGKIYQDNEEHTVFIPKTPIEVFSLNKESGSIEKKNIQYVWRLRGGNTIKINLRNGFEIQTTPEHRYLIFKDGFKYIEAK